MKIVTNIETERDGVRCSVTVDGKEVWQRSAKFGQDPEELRAIMREQDSVAWGHVILEEKRLNAS